VKAVMANATNVVLCQTLILGFRHSCAGGKDKKTLFFVLKKK
jgi:hypothetical protein